MKKLYFKTNKDFKRAFKTLRGNFAEGQFSLKDIQSINGVEVNKSIYEKAITDITLKHGVQSFDDDVKVSAPYTVSVREND